MVALLLRSFTLFVISALITSAKAEPPFNEIPEDLSVQQVATVTNDRNATETDVYLVVDDYEQIHGLYFDERVSDLGESASGSGLYWAEEIAAPQGVVVLRDSGRDVIRLRGQIQEKRNEAKLYLRYLSNGLFTKYKECPFGLYKSSQDDPWVLFNIYNREIVRQLHVETWLLGISSIPSICID